jgi:hypothetical protein
MDIAIYCEIKGILNNRQNTGSTKMAMNADGLR